MSHVAYNVAFGGFRAYRTGGEHIPVAPRTPPSTPPERLEHQCRPEACILVQHNLEIAKGMMGTAQQKGGQMKDMSEEKTSQATDATKGMGQSIMGKAQEGKDQTGSFFQQVID